MEDKFYWQIGIQPNFFSFDKIEDNIIFKQNGRQLIFFDRMEDDLNFNINRRQAK